MRARRPEFDFSETPARWAAIPEFAQLQNANSSWLPYLERFLNHVMARAAKEMKGDDPEAQRIKSDVQKFIRQEANHYSVHESFNAAIKRQGYDLEQFEPHFEEEFERLLNTKSLAFLCAYCQGFETFGPPSAVVWLDEMEDLAEGADPQVVTFWKWHLMEEYEHRTVCYDVFQRIHGGYFLRVYGLLYQLFHIQRLSSKVSCYLLGRDREGMNTAERKVSRKRARASGWRFGRVILLTLLKALSPAYDPRNAKEPKLYKSHMMQVEAALN